MLAEKKRLVDEYLSGKDPVDYGAISIGGDAYNTAGLIVIRLGETGLCLSDGIVTEDVSDKSVAEIIETIEDWAQTLREEALVTTPEGQKGWVDDPHFRDPLNRGKIDG